MSWLDKFTPDCMEKDISAYPPQFFLNKSIDRVVFDLDNTIAPYDKALPDEKAITYIRSLQGAGIEVMLVSNNEKERVDVFNEGLGLFAVHKAGKPGIKGIQACLEQSKNKGKAAFVGDQIFTDCLAARRAGLPCFLVDPIQPKESLFFKLKRLGEKPFVRRYKRKAAKNRQ